MAMFETWLKSDLQRPVVVKNLSGVVFSQDSKANQVGVIVTDGGEPVTLTGTVYGYIIRPDGTTLDVSGTIDQNDPSRAYFVMPVEAYQVGHITITIKLNSGNNVITTLGALTPLMVEADTQTGSTAGFCSVGSL